MSEAPSRLWELDALRGATVAAMVLVNNPGSWAPAASYSPLRHAAWNGCTFTDLIFPFFLFVVGVSLTLALQRRRATTGQRVALTRRVIGRGLALLLLGLLQARFPLLERGPHGLLAELRAAGTAGIALRASLLGVVLAAAALLSGHGPARRWTWLLLACALAAGVSALLDSATDRQWLIAHLLNARVPGVLQRIGLCSMAAGALVLARRRPRWIAAWAAGLLLAYAVWSVYVPVPGIGRPDLDVDLTTAGDAHSPRFSNGCAWVDTRVFGARCERFVRAATSERVLWAFDPEGLPSTIPAVATTLLGACFGLLLGAPAGARARFLLRLIAASVGLALLGLVWGRWLPLNKQLWSSSYVLWTGGLAGAVLSTLLWMGERLAPAGLARRLSAPGIWLGRNAILVFLGSSLAATLSIHLRVIERAADGAARWVPLKTWVFDHGFAGWAPLRLASLLFALCVVLLWTVVAGALHRRRLFVRL